jgi:hypothetical protein
MIASTEHFKKFEKNILQKKYFVLISFVLSIIISYLTNDKSFFIVAFIICYLCLEPLVMMCHFIYILSKHHICDRKEIVIENGKKYTVKHYDITGTVKFFFKRKLHREKNLPAVYRLEDCIRFDEEYYFLGKKINKNDLNKIVTQHNIEGF